MMYALVSMAFARPPQAPLPVHGEHLDAFALAGHGRAFGGLAIVVHDGPHVVLEALGPGGPSLFTVTVDGAATIEAIDPQLQAFLARLPFARDLAALYLTQGLEAARVVDWVVRPRRDGWVVRGPGGRARVERTATGLVLTDRLRGYSLTVTPQETP